jgi:hypothetical protein
MTVSEIIAALGGNRAVASLCDVGASAVSNWKAHGKFPERVHFRIYRACKENDIAISEADLAPQVANETAA